MLKHYNEDVLFNYNITKWWKFQTEILYNEEAEPKIIIQDTWELQDFLTLVSDKLIISYVLKRTALCKI